MPQNEYSLHLIDNKSFLAAGSYHYKNLTYRLWEDEWKAIYADQKSDHHVQGDTFFRYDVLVSIVRNDEVVGMSAHSFFELNDRAAMNVEFFQTYSPAVVAGLRADGSTRLVTYESLLTHRSFREKKHQIPIGALLLRFGTLQFLQSRADAMVGIVRFDNSACRLACAAGFQVVEENVPCRNFPCHAIAMRKHEATPLDPKVEKLAQELWQGRTEHGGLLAQPMSEPSAARRLKVA